MEWLLFFSSCGSVVEFFFEEGAKLRPQHCSFFREHLHNVCVQHGLFYWWCVFVSPPFCRRRDEKFYSIDVVSETDQSRSLVT